MGIGFSKVAALALSGGIVFGGIVVGLVDHNSGVRQTALHMVPPFATTDRAFAASADETGNGLSALPPGTLPSTTALDATMAPADETTGAPTTVTVASSSTTGGVDVPSTATTGPQPVTTVSATTTTLAAPTTTADLPPATLPRPTSTTAATCQLPPPATAPAVA